jgi:hypothetical protein
MRGAPHVLAGCVRFPEDLAGRRLLPTDLDGPLLLGRPSHCRRLQRSMDLAGGDGGGPSSAKNGERSNGAAAV